MIRELLVLCGGQVLTKRKGCGILIFAESASCATINCLANPHPMVKRKKHVRNAVWYADCRSKHSFLSDNLKIEKGNE